MAQDIQADARAILEQLAEDSILEQQRSEMANHREAPLSQQQIEAILLRATEVALTERKLYDQASDFEHEDISVRLHSKMSAAMAIAGESDKLWEEFKAPIYNEERGAFLNTTGEEIASVEITPLHRRLPANTQETRVAGTPPQLEKDTQR